MATTSQPNEETQELIRLLYQTKNTLTILSYNDLTDENVKHVISSFSRYEPNHERSSFSINDAKDVTANVINILICVQNLKYHDNINKSAIWLQRFMKAQKVLIMLSTYT